MSQQFRIEPAQLVFRYIVALVLIVVFVVGGHAMNLVVYKQGALDAETINISGQQRMLSQRIVLLSTLYNKPTSEGYDALLADSVRKFETNHDWIMANAVVKGTPVETHYSGLNGADLDQRSRAFAGLARTLLEDAPGSQSAMRLGDRLEEWAVVDLLRDLNAAVGLFEDAARTRHTQMERIQIAGLAATLLLLALEIILIFHPAHRTMVGMIGRLRREAWHDPLTGLTNRARFMARVSDMFNDPDKAKRLFVLALDLDGFKAVNDTLGHPVGDQVLKTAAKILEARLQSETRLGDSVVARFGGDEFMICGYLPVGDLEAFCVELGEIVISEIEVPMVVTLGDGRMDRCVVGVSIGYSLSEQTGGNVDIFLSNADIALYESKRRGKGVATAFRRSMREAAESRHHQTTELKSGIRGMEFQAYFQPQISLEDGKLVGVEALARWHHPERGLIGPDQFIGIAEECHMIDALDGQIMLDAFQAYRQSRMEGFDLGRLSINASGPALREPDFCDLLYNVAVGHDIHPSHVTVEILENIFIQEDTDPAIQTLQKLCRAGFGVAIDDFGVGYSSLSRISRGEISAIKIDRSLVRLSGTGNMDSILRATAAMAKGINATLLAEGIETEAQRVAMKALGVEVGQGFLWSKPLPISELKQWTLLRRDKELRLVSNN